MKTKRCFFVSIFLLGSLFSEAITRPNGCKGPVLCPISLEDSEGCCRKWHLDVGLLYQQPSFNDLDPGILYFPVFVEDPDHYQDQSIAYFRQCLDYAIGLSLSGGTYLKHDDWYFGARYDWLRSYGRALMDATDQPSLHLRPNPKMDRNVYIGTGFDFDTDTFNQIFYLAVLEENTLDVYLKRGSFHSKCFSYSPYVGVKGLWFRTEQKVLYISEDIESFANPSGIGRVQHVWGAGPLFGFKGQYYFTNSLSLFSDSDVGLLYGTGHISNGSEVIGQINTDVLEDRIVVNKSNVDCEVLLPVRSILGIEFSQVCFEDRHHFAVKLGMDIRLVFPYPAKLHGFSMGGLYANLSWDF